MKHISIEKKLLKSLADLKIKKGDTLFIHSNLNILFKEQDVTLRESVEILLKCLKKILGPRGTIVVPAYYYEYGFNKKIFDINNSPISPELGIFPKFIIAQKKSLRSLNPITSVVANGYNSKKICNMNTCSGYGVDSPFDILTNLNAKMVFLGVDLRYMTYVHYVEFMVGVPHRYNKLFLNPIKKNNKRINLPVISQVRYKNVISDSVENNIKFERAKIVQKAKFNSAIIRSLNFKDVFTFLKKKLQKNVFYLLKEKPVL
jgi:aminoglycoside 3-N-acetyltransferase